MRLYVLVRKDLSPADQAVQAGHAIAEWCIRHPEGAKAWGNDVLVLLGVQNADLLSQWARVLEDGALPHIVFREPDMGDQATALAISHERARGLFRGLRLLEVAA